jgi:GTP-binding protein EngB required for normal cell division
LKGKFFQGIWGRIMGTMSHLLLGVFGGVFKRVVSRQEQRLMQDVFCFAFLLILLLGAILGDVLIHPSFLLTLCLISAVLYLSLPQSGVLQLLNISSLFLHLFGVCVRLVPDAMAAVLAVSFASASFQSSNDAEVAPLLPMSLIIPILSLLSIYAFRRRVESLVESLFLQLGLEVKMVRFIVPLVDLAIRFHVTFTGIHSFSLSSLLRRVSYIFLQLFVVLIVSSPAFWTRLVAVVAYRTYTSTTIKEKLLKWMDGSINWDSLMFHVGEVFAEVVYSFIENGRQVITTLESFIPVPSMTFCYGLLAASSICRCFIVASALVSSLWAASVLSPVILVFIAIFSYFSFADFVEWSSEKSDTSFLTLSGRLLYVTGSRACFKACTSVFEALSRGKKSAEKKMDPPPAAIEVGKDDIVFALFGSVSAGKSSLMQAVHQHLTGSLNQEIRVDQSAGTTIRPFFCEVAGGNGQPRKLLIDIPGWHHPNLDSNADVVKTVEETLSQHLSRTDVAVFVIETQAISQVYLDMFTMLKEKMLITTETLFVVRNHRDIWEANEDGDARAISDACAAFGIPESQVLCTDFRGYDPKLRRDLAPEYQRRSREYAIKFLSGITSMKGGQFLQSIQEKKEKRRALALQHIKSEAATLSLWDRVKVVLFDRLGEVVALKVAKLVDMVEQEGWDEFCFDWFPGITPIQYRKGATWEWSAGNDVWMPVVEMVVSAGRWKPAMVNQFIILLLRNVQHSNQHNTETIARRLIVAMQHQNEQQPQQ